VLRCAVAVETTKSFVALLRRLSMSGAGQAWTGQKVAVWSVGGQQFACLGTRAKRWHVRQPKLSQGFKTMRPNTCPHRQGFVTSCPRRPLKLHLRQPLCISTLHVWLFQSPRALVLPCDQNSHKTQLMHMVKLLQEHHLTISKRQ
jgi:hypothetical protein